MSKKWSVGIVRGDLHDGKKTLRCPLCNFEIILKKVDTNNDPLAMLGIQSDKYVIDSLKNGGRFISPSNSYGAISYELMFH